MNIYPYIKYKLPKQGAKVGCSIYIYRNPMIEVPNTSFALLSRCCPQIKKFGPITLVLKLLGFLTIY